MPVRYKNSTGGITSDGVTRYTLVDTWVELPDAYPGNVLIVGAVQAVAAALPSGASNAAYQTLQTLQTNSLALPAVPGSGQTYWNIQVDVTSGATTIQTSNSAPPAPINGNNVIVCASQVNSGDTVPWARQPSFPDNWP